MQIATSQLQAAIASKNQALAAKALDHLLQAMKTRDGLDVEYDSFKLTSAAGMTLSQICSIVMHALLIIPLRAANIR